MKANKKSIEVREKDRQALELRKAGASYEVIAKQLGYADSSGAYKSIQRSMKSILLSIQRQLKEVHEAEKQSLTLDRANGVRITSQLKAVGDEIKSVAETCSEYAYT